MPYQYVREPLTAEESDCLSNACETPTERLVVWTLLDTGLRVSELCALTSKNVLWQQRQLQIKGKGKGGPHGKNTKIRVVPMSNRVRALLEHPFALEKAFPLRRGAPRTAKTPSAVRPLLRWGHNPYSLDSTPERGENRAWWVRNYRGRFPAGLRPHRPGDVRQRIG